RENWNQSELHAVSTYAASWRPELQLVLDRGAPAADSPDFSHRPRAVLRNETMGRERLRIRLIDMLRYPGYLIYSMLLLTGVTWAEYRGWSMSRVNEVKNVPKTVRDNPGAYRSHYGYYPRYVGGK